MFRENVCTHFDSHMLNNNRNNISESVWKLLIGRSRERLFFSLHQDKRNRNGEGLTFIGGPSESPSICSYHESVVHYDFICWRKLTWNDMNLNKAPTGGDETNDGKSELMPSDPPSG